MEWLDPDEIWPVHQRKEAREALSDAKGQGWSFASFSAHAFGKIRCPIHNDPACEVTIFSSGRGDKSGAVTAKVVRDKLRSCRSREGDTTQPVSDPLAALLRAERLSTAAERLRRSERLRFQSEDRMTRAGDAGDSDIAEQFLDEASAADERASVEERAAQVDAYRFGLGEPWPPDEGAAELEKAAREQLEVASAGSSMVDDPEQFKRRLELVRQRLGDG